MPLVLFELAGNGIFSGASHCEWQKFVKILLKILEQIFLDAENFFTRSSHKTLILS